VSAGPRRPARKTAEETAPAPEETQRKAKAPRDEIVLDVVNERALIRAAIADRGKRDVLTRTLAPDEFLHPAHSPIWRALRVETDHGLEHDPEVFIRLVAEEGGSDVTYLAELERTAGVPENLDWRISTVRWDACRARIAMGTLPALLAALKDPKASQEQVSNAARAIARAVEGGGARRFIRRGPELARSYKAELRARIATGNFWPWGFGAMDEHWTEGSMPKKTALIVGLSGSGKSTFVAEFVRRLAALGRRVLYGAWEMGTESTLDLMAAAMARVETTRLVRGDIDAEEEIVRLERCVDWLTERITFFDNPFFESSDKDRRGRADNNRSLDVLEGYIAESGCDVVVYDLWERMLIDLSYEGVTKALYRQQNMHDRYNVFGVLVHQLKGKEVEARADKRPTREGVKGSGAFVEVCDQLVGIHRDAQFRRVPDDTIEAICLKQRKGKAFWATRFEWNPDLSLVSGDGVEVPYDPGLENSEQFGDVNEIKVNRGRGRVGQRKPSRRDG
jgi:replicative DNA helicase